MRNTMTFTDGRIHVTLYEGAYDLRELSTAERLLYDELLADYTEGLSLTALERRFERCSLRSEEALGALYRDLCRRVEVYALSCDIEFAEGLCPWRPAQTREHVEAALA